MQTNRLFIIFCSLIASLSCNKQNHSVLSGEIMKKKEALHDYQQRRNFTTSPEPTGEGTKRQDKASIFVIQKHAARNLHYDFRLEIDGVLKSWAVPKGPSINPIDKRLAVPTEDHPMAYADFEGIIPTGNYGAGTVMIWDTGTYENIKKKNGKLIPLKECYEKGQIEIILHGKKLHGGFTLIRLTTSGQERWLLIKMRDEYADARKKPVTSEPNSALTGRTMAQIKNEE
jgi:DNA ligase D-like protein (predicted 3'-phosphoesterase)